MELKPTDSVFQHKTRRVVTNAIMREEVIPSIQKFRPNLTGQSKEYLMALVDYNQYLSEPFDLYFVVSQWYLETGGGEEEYWIRDGNPAGIGIWKDGVPSPWSGKLQPHESAVVHLVELALHCYDLDKAEYFYMNLRMFDDVWQEVYHLDNDHLIKVLNLRRTFKPLWPNDPIIDSLNNLIPPNNYLWAADPNYDTKLVSRARDLFPWLKGEPSMSVNVGKRPLRIAIGAGHANTSDGDDFERALNQKVTNEVVKLCRASDGFEVRSYTPNDGLGFFNGPLDAAAAQVTGWLNQGWKADILHELHHEGTGTPSIRGGFVIYPDSAGLVGRNAGNIDLDVQNMAGKMAQIIVSEFGGVCRYPACDRGMSERETGVGGQGFRLGVFGAWAEPYFTDNSFAFITEAATYTNPTDLAIMQGPDFARKEALGIVKAYAALAKARGNWTYDYRIGVSAVANTPDGLPYPAGLDEGLLKLAFGSYVGAAPGNPSFRYVFNPKGPISRAWYGHFKASGKFPRLSQSFVDGERWYLFFSDGSVMWRGAANEAWKFSS